MNTFLTLDAVQAAFQDWRQHKAHHCSRTPRPLKAQVLALLAQHSRTELCQALGITRRMLNTREGIDAPAEVTAPPPEFVMLPVEPVPDLPSNGTLQLDLTEPNGNHWCSLEPDDDDAMVQLQGYSITYRLAVGPQQGRKFFTLQTQPADDVSSGGSDRVAEEAGFSLYAGVSTEAHQRDKLERLCR